MTITANDYQRFGRRVTSLRTPVLLTHTRAAGDALGSLIALRSILTALGREPTSLTFEPAAAKYRWLVDEIAIDVWGDGDPPRCIRQADGVIVCDTCTYNQLEPAADWLRSLRHDGSIPILAIDHHVTRDDIADDHLTDTTAAAVCIVLYELAQANGWPLDIAAATALFVGIATDTGWFRYSNTDARTLAAAARLVDAGLNPNVIYDRLFQSDAPHRVRLFGAALRDLELHHDGATAVMTVSADTLESFGASPNDTEDLISEALRIQSVEVAVLLCQQDRDPGTPVKVSFRSRSRVDVAALAARFGGGGHVRAAGARITGSLLDVKERILRELQNQGT